MNSSDEMVTGLGIMGALSKFVPYAELFANTVKKCRLIHFFLVESAAANKKPCEGTPMKRVKEWVFLGSLILLAPASGFACSTAQWDSSSGAITAESPAAPAPANSNPSRLSELCGLRVTNTGHVQDNSPDGHTTFIARFYVRPQLTGGSSADLFIAYSSETPSGQLVKVSYDGANLDFHAAGAQAGTAAAAPGLWHLVEVEYVSAGTTSFWVNADAEVAGATGSFASATGAVTAVRLGLPNGLGGHSGYANFDAYESHSTTPVGPLLIGDSNGVGGISIADATNAIAELNGTLAVGQPDCNSSGVVTIADATCIIGKIP